MPKLRVLHIIKSLDIGGIENLALDFCRNAAHHDIDMHLVCIGGGGLENEFAESGVHFKTFPKMKFPYDAIDPWLVYRLRRYIKKHKIEVVHSHFADEGLHIYFATLGMKRIAKLVSIAVDLRINRKIDNLKFRFLAARVDATVAPSQVVVEQIRQHGMSSRQNACFVHNGIDPQRILQQENSTLRKELNIPQQAVVGGMIGNFYNNVRDQLTVCRALPQVIETFPEFHFVFAGGSHNQWVEEASSKYRECYDYCSERGLLHRVHFVGLRLDVSNILKSLDLYVHSTNFDTFGIAPVEAMLNKKPVIGNDIAVFREISNDGQGMLLFKTKDTTDLAAKLISLAQDAEKRKQLGQQHFEHASTSFHIDAHIQRMKDLYLHILSTKRPHRI